MYLYTLFEKKGTMKTAIKLVLVYFVMQILAALLAMPFAMLYSYAVSGTIDGANTIAFTRVCYWDLSAWGLSMEEGLSER